MRVLMIDNYDSFTYNLVQALGAMGHELMVFRNDRITLDQVRALKPERIVISPGPGRPEQSGISPDVIRAFSSEIWTLGVCLGHQCIATVFGVPVGQAPEIMHGKTSWVVHDNHDIHRGVANPFQAMRYHSLAVREEDLPDYLVPSARTLEGTLMGVRHKTWKLVGVQYHPESFLTAPGVTVLKNFMELP
jgi:anthranilate synthase/aminodeoxychorismate synthase-like glutamine amidotransferase